jgi:hypothetical protein
MLHVAAVKVMIVVQMVSAPYLLHLFISSLILLGGAPLWGLTVRCFSFALLENNFTSRKQLKIFAS